MKKTVIGLCLLVGACQGASPEQTVSEDTVRSVAEIHDRTLTLDTHIDIPLEYMTEIDPKWETELQVDIPKLKAGQLDSGFWIIYTPQGELSEAGYAAARRIAGTRFRAIQAFTNTYTNDVVLCTSAEDVRQAVLAGKHAVLIGMENAYPLGESVESVPLWARRGVRYVGLTHFGHNQFGDSSNPNPLRDDGPRHNGLSPLGKDLIAALNNYGIMVDVSHAGKETMMQAADISRTPIIASHSGVKAVADSPRNLDDEQLRKIAEVGGVAQMVALDTYVKPLNDEQMTFRDALRAEYGLDQPDGWSTITDEDRAAYDLRSQELWQIAPRATVSDFVDHIDYAVSVAGIDHVGIASDFDGGGGVVGWEDASDTQNVTAELIQRGYTDEQITKIWGGNLLRVMEAVEAQSNL